jgi:PKD repeat protein
MIGKIPNRIGIGLVILLVAFIVIILFSTGSVVDFFSGDGLSPATAQESDGNNEGSIAFSSFSSPLMAEASADPISGQSPLKVNFTGSAIGGTPPYIFEWDFNQDGVPDAKEKIASYVYAASQVQTTQVTLTVTDATGIKAIGTVTLDIHPTNLSYPADLTIRIGGIYYLELRNTTKGVSFPVSVINKNPVDVEAVRVVINVYKWQSPSNSSVVWHREVYDNVISVPKAEKGFWGYYYATKTIPLTIRDLDEGIYSLQAYVNPGASVPETDYSDNSAVKSFELSRRLVLPSVWACRQW